MEVYICCSATITIIKINLSTWSRSVLLLIFYKVMKVDYIHILSCYDNYTYGFEKKLKMLLAFCGCESLAAGAPAPDATNSGLLNGRSFLAIAPAVAFHVLGFIFCTLVRESDLYFCSRALNNNVSTAEMMAARLTWSVSEQNTTFGQMQHSK